MNALAPATDNSDSKVQRIKASAVNDLAIRAREKRSALPKLRKAPWIFGPVIFIFLLVLMNDPLGAMYAIPLTGTVVGLYLAFAVPYLAGQLEPVTCHNCRKFLNMKTAWVCACCDGKNQKVDFHSFLDTCGICREKPSGIWCPHCNTENMFEVDGQKDRIAHFVGSSAPQKPKAPDVKDWRAEQMAEIKFKLDLTKMNTDLVLAEKAFKEAKALGKNKPETTGSKLEKRFDESFNRSVELHRIVEKKKKEAEKLFGDNPQMLALANEAIQAKALEELQREEV